MSKKNKKASKLRAEFRKRHDTRSRTRDLTRDYHEHGFEQDESAREERVSGKGDLSRKRTVIGAEAAEEETGFAVRFDIDDPQCQHGRVLSVHGLTSKVQAEDGEVYDCATRGLLKNLSTDLRHVVVAGDKVVFRPTSSAEGLILSVEPRRGTLSRASRGRRHVIVSNIEQLFIVASAAEPNIKPNLIDRFLVVAEQHDIQPVICINKIDLVNPADFQPLVGVYGQMGYDVLFLSAETGFGVERLRRRMVGRESVIAGQSGVGK